jgi:hypothetical protein
MGYKEDLEIDQYALEEGWLKQAVLYAKWAEEAVNANYEVDKLRESLDLKRAELDGKIRNDPAIYGIAKITESAISAAILMNAEYQEANNKVLEASRNAKILAVARDSFEHKKKALEKLTDLFLSNYWADKMPEKKIEKAAEVKSTDKFQEDMKSRRLKRRTDGGECPVISD